ncbi:NYN domain-containing protein [Chroococcidiopsis sp.]|uniref:NYN domain-containing protein n=1 Tax=Chroococcidiopsis sp. TaxID=3088168 RepID=UPI003F2B6F9C
MSDGVSHKITRLAVLIDADNVEASIVEPLLKEITSGGIACVKRIYGDWTQSQLSSWKEKLHKFAIQPIQQFSYTSGKNSTDSALIIDAMDLLYTNKFDGFCIVSSDSDFTKLACRIRESGLIVYGFGEQKTPEAFVKACDRFIYIESLSKKKEKQETCENISSKTESPPSKNLQKTFEEVPSKLQHNRELLELVKTAYELAMDKDGWACISSLKSRSHELSPSFKSNSYDYATLGKLMQAIELFEIKQSPQSRNPKYKNISIKLKHK